MVELGRCGIYGTGSAEIFLHSKRKKKNECCTNETTLC